MHEQEAQAFAARCRAAWPNQIIAAIEQSAMRLRGPRYAVRLHLVPCNRILRLVSRSECAGILDVCRTLLGPESACAEPARCPPRRKRGRRGKSLTEEEISAIRARYGCHVGRFRRGRGISLHELARDYHVSVSKIRAVLKEQYCMNDETADQEPTDSCPPDALLSEEEAARYLGVKPATVRTYMTNGILPRTERNGRHGLLLADVEQYRRSRRDRRSERAGGSQEDEGSKPGQAWPAMMSEVGILQELVSSCFAQVPGILSLAHLSENPRSWQLEILTVGGPESYRAIRQADGSFRLERR